MSGNGVIPDLGVRKIDQNDGLPPVLGVGFSGAQLQTLATALHSVEIGAILQITFSLDTAIYASGDVLADTQEIANAVQLANGIGVLQSLVLNDKDNQRIALDLVFFSANVSLGAENAPPTITDANADSVLGIVSVLSSDWINLGNCGVATIPRVGMEIKADANKSIWVGAITRGAPTHTASGITGRFGIL